MRNKALREAFRIANDTSHFIGDFSPLMVDPFVYLMDTKVPKKEMVTFLQNTDLESDDEEYRSGLESDREKVVAKQSWRTHEYFGIVYTVQSSNDYYFTGDEKLSDGILDDKYVKKKSSRSMFEEREGGREFLSRKQLMKKMLAENNIVAFTAKGNSKYSQNHKIVVDYLVTFNGNMRMTVMTEGEGPFAAEISNYCCRRLVILFEKRFMKERNTLDIGVIMRHSMEDLDLELKSDDSSRGFDVVLTGVAGKAP